VHVAGALSNVFTIMRNSSCCTLHPPCILTHTRVPPSGDASVEAADDAYGLALAILRAANGGKGFEHVIRPLARYTNAQIKEMDPAVVARLYAAQLKAAGKSGGACLGRTCTGNPRAAYPRSSNASTP
jgi:hypothetical protein